jgi:hypothetical protein
MQSEFPVPTLDHVVVNARDRIDDAADRYRRLGFTLTPRGYHTLGSMNHLAMFGTDYLELIAARPGDDSRPEIMGAPLGLDGLVFGTEDAAETHRALLGNGVSIDDPQQFSRPVQIGDVTRDAVWRDEWRHHANGAVGIARAVIAAEDPLVLGGLFARMFGAPAVRPTDDGCSLILGLSRFDVVTPTALWEMFGGAAPDSRGRRDYMAALTIRTLSLDAVETVLEAGGIRGWDRIGTSVLVPAPEAFGVTIEFSV